MNLLIRFLAAAGLLALGFYVGREVGRLEPVREELKRVRERPAEDDPGAEHIRTSAAEPS